jgi:hypothetical protein
MTKNTNSKQYDLEDRTLDFSNELMKIFGAILQKSK